MRKILRIVNAKRQELAEIRWTEPGEVSVHADDAELKTSLTRLLADGRKNGIPLRGGSAREINGQTAYVETVERIRPNDARFVEALSDVISATRFRGERLFGLIKREEG
jgi:hypothetical protein